MAKLKINYYHLTWAEEDEKTGTAYTDDSTLLAHELVNDVWAAKTFPFKLSLREGSLQDYLGNNLAWPLMSERLKDLIKNNLSGKEGVVWILASVAAGGDQIPYFIPSFISRLDVLDIQRTSYVPGTEIIIKPVFSVKKLGNYEMFHLPDNNLWKITSGLYVSERIKKEIEKAAFTGLAFEKTRVE